MWVTFCMQKWIQERTYKQKAAGKPVTWSGETQSWPSVVVEGDVGSGGGFPSFSPVSSVSLLSPLLCFSVIFSSSPLSLRGCQWRSGGGEEAQWQLRLFFFFGIYFFLCHFPFSPLPPPNVPPISIIFLSGRSLLPLLFFSSSSILPCFPFFLPLVSAVSVRFSSLLSLWKTYCFSLLVSPFSLKNCRSLSLFLLPFSFKKNPSSSIFPFLFFFVLFSASLFIGRVERKITLSCPVQSWDKAGWLGRSLCSRPRTAWRAFPLWFFVHGRPSLRVQASGGAFRMVFGFWERERSKTQGKTAPSSPVLCVSRGRRRLMVLFKTAMFTSFFFVSFFFQWNAWNDAVLAKTRRFI